jgi:hypothetical protein
MFPPRRSVRVVVTLVAALAGWALSNADARAHFQISLYTQSSCFGSDVDPVTNVYWDVGSGERATNHVEYHTGWLNEQGSPQWFTSHDRCFAAYAQRASGGVTSSRFHTRLSPLLDTTPWWYSVGGAHHEDFTYCGHAVDKTVNGWSGFDAGRRAIYDAMLGEHEYDYVIYGNSRQFRQCDGDYAGSNGLVGWWRVPSWEH